MNGESVGNSVLPIDYAQPFANIRGVPLWLLPSRLSPQDHAAIESLHARGRAAHHLADYAALAVLDDDQMPARHHRVICEHLDDLMADRYDELIVCTPPGSAKSTYTSHALASHFMGRWPRRSIILATHTADLSEKWSRKVRNTIASARHSLVFPDPGCQLSRDSTAVGRWATAAGGEFLAVGVGASILGFRADCLTENALVCTKIGYTSISNINPGDEVLSYDSKEFSIGYRRVLAVAERKADIIYRIHAADGRVVEATGNHPFYSGGKFVPAMALAVGDPLLSCMWDCQDDTGIGDFKADRPVKVGNGVLFPFMREQSQSAANHPELSGVRVTIPSSSQNNTMLFPCLFDFAAATVGKVMQVLRSVIQAAQQQVGVLFGAMQECRPCEADAFTGKSELAARKRPEPLLSRSWTAVPGGEEDCHVSGQSGMRGLFLNGKPSRTPRGREFGKQLYNQRRDAVQVMSHDLARRGAGETAETTVARIEVVRGNTRVFDIQVEGTANFFANGILVHNCAIIDDPIGGFEQAQSITQLKKVQGWFETDLITRLKPRAKLVLICQRLSPNDLAGYLIERNRVNPTRRQRVLSLRMECEADDCDPTTGLDLLGRRQGERLWPEWFTSEQVEDARRDDFKWRTLYQQRPPSDSGSWVSTDDIQFRPTPPAALEPSAVTYGATDLALSVNTGDYTVHAVIAVTSGPGGDEWDIVHAERARVDTNASAERIVALSSTWHPFEWLIDDDNASRVFVNDVATRARAARVPVPWRPMPMRGQDKETRAAALRGQFKRRRVWMPPDAPFTGWLTRELLTFPNAIGQGVDDGVDCLGLFGRRLSSMASPSPVPSPSSITLKTVQNMCLEELYEDLPSTVTNRI